MRITFPNLLGQPSLPRLPLLCATAALWLVVFPTRPRTAGLPGQDHRMVGVPVTKAITVPHHTHHLITLHLSLHAEHHLEGDWHHRHDGVFCVTWYDQDQLNKVGGCCLYKILILIQCQLSWFPWSIIWK